MGRRLDSLQLAPFVGPQRGFLPYLPCFPWTEIALQRPRELHRLAFAQRFHLRREVEPGLELAGLVGAAHDDVDGSLRGADAGSFDFAPGRGAELVVDLEAAGGPFEVAAKIVGRG